MRLPRAPSGAGNDEGVPGLRAARPGTRSERPSAVTVTGRRGRPASCRRRAPARRFAHPRVEPRTSSSSFGGTPSETSSATRLGSGGGEVADVDGRRAEPSSRQPSRSKRKWTPSTSASWVTTSPPTAAASCSTPASPRRSSSTRSSNSPTIPERRHRSEMRASVERLRIERRERVVEPRMERARAFSAGGGVLGGDPERGERLGGRVERLVRLGGEEAAREGGRDAARPGHGGEQRMRRWRPRRPARRRRRGRPAPVTDATNPNCRAAPPRELRRLEPGSRSTRRRAPRRRRRRASRPRPGCRAAQ